MPATLDHILQFLEDGHWHSLAECAQHLRVPVGELWDPIEERPRRGILRHGERIYALQVHRHALTPTNIAIALPTVSAAHCPLCQQGQPYTPSPWAIWDNPQCYATTDAAEQAIRTYIQTHPGWHHPTTMAQAWQIPVSANLVQGTDNKTLGALLQSLKYDPAFVVHRHLHVIGEYTHTETWVTTAPSLQCPDCQPMETTARCPRCDAPLVSEADVIDRIQGFHGSTGLTVWHLDPPGCPSCLPMYGWQTLPPAPTLHQKRKKE